MYINGPLTRQGGHRVPIRILFPFFFSLARSLFSRRRTSLWNCRPHLCPPLSSSMIRFSLTPPLSSGLIPRPSRSYNVAASENSIMITSTAGTTSTSGLSTRGAMQKCLLQCASDCARFVGFITGRRGGENDHKCDVGTPSVPDENCCEKARTQIQ